MVNDTITQHIINKTSPKTIFFTSGEIWNTIRKLPSKRAPGPDRISNCALKRSGKRAFIYFCHIFNGCADLEYYSDPWKEASIIMLPNSGKNTKHTSNHSPTFLLNSMSKTLEKLILNRLNIITMPKIRPEQFGFRSQLNTTTQLINIIDHITNK